MLNNTACIRNYYAVAEHCYICVFLDTQIDKFPKVLEKNIFQFQILRCLGTTLEVHWPMISPGCEAITNVSEDLSTLSPQSMNVARSCVVRNYIKYLCKPESYDLIFFKF